MSMSGQLQTLLVGIVFDHQDTGDASVADIDIAGATDKWFQGHDRLQRCGDNHLKAEVFEDVHSQRGELVVCLVKGFIEHHWRIRRHAMLIATQLVAQRRGEAGRGQLLSLTAGFA